MGLELGCLTCQQEVCIFLAERLKLEDERLRTDRSVRLNALVNEAGNDESHTSVHACNASVSRAI